MCCFCKCKGYKCQSIAFDYWLFCFHDLRVASLVVSIGHVIASIALLVLIHLKVVDIEFPPFLAAIVIILVVYSWLTVILVKCNTLPAIKVPKKICY